MNYRLSPSDLTFLYDGRKHCLVLKVKLGVSQPSIPLPAIFSKIGSLQKEYYSGKRTEACYPGLPRGVVTYSERQVRSRTIESSGLDSTCYISGRFDIVADLEDGSFAVFDFKTGSPSDEKVEMYARQLRAYTLALENPADGALCLRPITTLGLLYFTPDRCELSGSMRQLVDGAMQWVEVKRDDAGFMAFLRGVVTLLDGPLLALEPETCDWCRFRLRTGASPAGSAATVPGHTSSPATPTCPTCGGSMRLVNGKFGEFWSCMAYPTCRGTRKV